MKYIFFLLIFFLSSSCFEKKNYNEVSLNSEIFGLPETDFLQIDKMKFPVIELKGKHQILEDEFVEMKGYAFLQKSDSFLIFMNANARKDHICLVYSLPDFKFHKKIFKYGYGPEEFSRIRVRFNDTSNKKGNRGYLYDLNYCNYYSIDKDFKLVKTKEFTNFEFEFIEPYFLNDTTIYYTNKAEQKGANIYRTSISSGYPGNPLIDLQILPDVDFFYTYRIDYAINENKNRIMYGYYFFNEVRVHDLNGNLLRKVIGPDKNRHINSNDMDMWLDNMDRKNYYAKCFSTDDFFYIKYLHESTLGERTKGEYKNQTIIRKFDWNGNPVCDFVLDKKNSSSEFYVDESNKRIFILSSYEDDPLYIYYYD